MEAGKIINGSFGKVWFNDTELGNIKSFEAKMKAKYEDIDIANELGDDKKFIGYSITGTMVLHKTDSTIAKAVFDSWNEGATPTLTIVAKNADPSADGDEKISLTGVTIDELTLLKIEQKKALEEEVPFCAKKVEYIDQI